MAAPAGRAEEGRTAGDLHLAGKETFGHAIVEAVNHVLIK
jgi:hypothetical protein